MRIRVLLTRKSVFIYLLVYFGLFVYLFVCFSGAAEGACERALGRAALCMRRRGVHRRLPHEEQAAQAPPVPQPAHGGANIRSRAFSWTCDTKVVLGRETPYSRNKRAKQQSEPFSSNSNVCAARVGVTTLDAGSRRRRSICVDGSRSTVITRPRIATSSIDTRVDGWRSTVVMCPRMEIDGRYESTDGDRRW